MPSSLKLHFAEILFAVLQRCFTGDLLKFIAEIGLGGETAVRCQLREGILTGQKAGFCRGDPAFQYKAGRGLPEILGKYIMKIGEGTRRDLPWGNRHYILLSVLTNTGNGSSMLKG